MASYKIPINTTQSNAILQSTRTGLMDLNVHPSFYKIHQQDVTDGDTLDNNRILGIDTFESFDSDKARKVEEAGLSLAEQKKLGLGGKKVLQSWVDTHQGTILEKRGVDVFGRGLVDSPELAQHMVESGTAVPTDRYDEKLQSIYRAKQEKLRKIDPVTAQAMEIQREYNIGRQKLGVLDRIGESVDAFQSGTQQALAGTADFVLDVVTPGDNTLLNELKSAESANKTWGYDSKEADFAKKEALHKFKNEEYVGAVMEMAKSPELWGESLPMIAEMAVGAGKFTALGKLIKVGTQGLKGAERIAEAKKIRDGATAMQKATLLGAENAGFLATVGDQTNRHIEEFTANNEGVGPSYGQIAEMTAMNVLQLGLDRYAFGELVAAKGGIQSLKDVVTPLLKVVPDNALGTIAKKVATTATGITVAIGTEAGQEYLQTWAEMLNTKAGTKKYGDWMAVLQNPEAQDEAIVGALAGAGMGGQMRAGVEIPGAVMNVGKATIKGIENLRTPKPQTEEQFLAQPATEDKVYDRTPIRETLSNVKDAITKGTGDLVGMFNELNSVETDALANDDTGSMKYIKEYKKKIADMLTKQTIEDDKLPTLGSHPEDVIADLYESTNNKTEIFESNIQKMATKAGINAERLQQIRDEATVEEEATVGEMGYRTYGRKLRALQSNPTPDAEKIEIIQSKMDNYVGSQESARDTIKSSIDKYIGEALAGKLGKFQKTFTYGEKKTPTTWNVKGKGGIEEWLQNAGPNPTKESLYKAMMDTTIGRLYQHKVRNIEGIKAEAKASGYNMSLGNKVVIPKGVSPKDKKSATMYKKRVEGTNKVIAIQTTTEPDSKVTAMKAANPKNVNAKEYMEDDTVLVVAPKSPRGRTVGSMLMSMKNAKRFGLAKLREQLDKAVAAKTTIVTNVISNRSTMDWVVGAYLKEKGYVEVNKDNELQEKTGKWIKSEKAVMPKPKAEKTEEIKQSKPKEETVEVETTYKPVKDILKDASTKGESVVQGQEIDITKIVTMKNIDEKTSAIVTGITEDMKETTTLMKQTMKYLKGIIAGTKEETKYWTKDSLGRGLLYDVEGNMNQATAAAIGMATEEYIAYSSSLLRPKDKADLEKALGMGTGQMSYETYNELKRVGIPRKMIIDALGKAVLGTLNLKMNKEVDTAIYDKLKSDLGMMSYLVMLKKGYTKETAIPTTRYGKMLGQLNKTYNKDATVTFATINRDNKKMDVGEIRDAYKVVEEQTKTTSTMRKGPLDKPAEAKVSKLMEYGEDDTVEVARKNQITDVPDKNVQGLNKLRTMKHVPVESAIEWIRNNVQTTKEHMGYVSNTKIKTMSYDAAESAEASNMEIDKSIEELVGLDIKDMYSKGMWFEWYFTKNGRYMMDSNTVNPQTDKLHRFVVIPEAWNVTVDKSNDKHMMAYYMAVAQATGFGIDKKSTKEARAQGKYIAENISGSKLKEALSNKTVMDAINKELKDAELAEIEVEHLGHWLQAAESIDAYKTGNTFKTNLSAEFDAVTSGFGNRIMQMPIVDNVDADKNDNKKQGWAARVGVFLGLLDEDLSMNDEISQEGFYDSYQELAKGIKRDAVEPTTDVDKQGWKVWKALSAALPAVDDGGIVTKELRTLFKDPFMTFNYSAGIASIKKSLGNGMVATILNELTMEKDSKGKPLSDEMQALYNELNHKDVVKGELRDRLKEESAGSIDTKVINSKTKKPYKLDEYLSQLIQESYGVQVEEILIEKFSPFMKANTTINATMKMMFQAWKEQYDKQVKEAGKDGKVVTAEDKMEILLGLREIFPIIRGPLSKGYEDGISIVDSVNAPSDPKYGATQTHINAQNIKGYDKKNAKGEYQKTIKVQAMVKEYEAAMNAGSVIPFHFIDGAEMLSLINKSKGGQFIHDAYIPPITDAIDDVQEYNKSVYEIGKTYNLVDALIESIERIKDYTETIEVNLRSNEFSVEESGMHTLTLNDVKHMVYELAIQTNEARTEYYKQDMTIAHMAGMPGSAYVVKGDSSHTEKSHEQKYPDFNPKPVKKLSKETLDKRAEKQVEETKEDMQGSKATIAVPEKAMDALLDELMNCE